MSNQMLSPVVRIVDDDASVCESQSFFLQLAGFRTRSFSSAEDFLRDDDAALLIIWLNRLNRKNSSLSSLRQLKRIAWSAVKKLMP